MSSLTDHRTGPTCFLHIGTHKTGTTSLQNGLAVHDGVLQSAGVLFPRAGRSRADAGHHNIAWELNGDERFTEVNGTFADLLAEVKAAEMPAVCLSSEDFEYLHDKPAALRRLRDGFAAIGYQTAVVVYLRPQASYAESLYAELVKHGFAQSFDDYLEAILRDGGIAFGRWRFTFDYDALLTDFANVFGTERMIVRPYARETMGTSLTRDFLRIVAGPAPIDLRPFRRVGRLNSSAPFIDVVRKLHANLAAQGRTRERELPAAKRAYRSRFDPVRLPEVARIAERFAAGNGRVAERYGVAVPFVTRLHLLGDIAAALGFDAGSEQRRMCLIRQAGNEPVRASGMRAAQAG